MDEEYNRDVDNFDDMIGEKAPTSGIRRGEGESDTGVADDNTSNECLERG